MHIGKYRCMDFERRDCLVFQVMEEGGQVSGENVEANPVAGRHLLGFCEDAERIRSFHLKTIVETTDLWQISVALIFLFKHMSYLIHTNVLVLGLRM